MDIYSILSSKPHNPHHLNRYINFIKQCQQKNVGYEGYVERHHICPKANDMFPEYKDFKLYPWNRIVLTARQHFIAHLILWKAFPQQLSCIKAVWNMSCRGNIFVDSRLYESLRIEAIKVMSSSLKDKVVVKHSNEPNKHYFRISKDDPRYLSGELVSVYKGTVLVKDKEENIFRTSIDDPRYLSGDLKHITTNRVAVKDKEGNYSLISKDDTRYLSGELVGVSKGMVTVKDKEGNIFNVSKDDPRYLSGELVPNLKGLKWYNNGMKNGMFLPGTEPFGYNPGKIHRKRIK